MQRISLAIVVLGLMVGAFMMARYDMSKNRSKSVKKSDLAQDVKLKRAGGFNVQGEAKSEPNASLGVTKISSAVFASGPMHSDEVIRFVGQASLVDSDGDERKFGPTKETFSERLEDSLNVGTLRARSTVKIDGQVYVYNRREIKVEREIKPDGSVTLYLNTGTVNFTKVPDAKPAQIRVECKNLGEVHLHGIELLSLDKKTVTHRLMLKEGIQLIERESMPYGSSRLKLEPIMISQLIPKRNEPFAFSIAVSN